VWRVHPDKGYYYMLANGALSTQAKLEGIVLRAAWHWGRDSSIVNDPLGEQGRTPSVRVGLCER
jgi:hypothetical protein